MGEDEGVKDVPDAAPHADRREYNNVLREKMVENEADDARILSIG